MEDKHTVNDLLVMQKSLAERRNQLKTLEIANSRDTIYRVPGQDTIEKALYDVSDLDKAIADLNMALYKIDRAIKNSNAQTYVEIPNVNYEELMKTINTKQ